MSLAPGCSARTAATTDAGRVIVCLPTYDEAANIEPMLAGLAHALGPDASVLVIDDGSPDGTADLAAGYGARHGGVEVLRRTRKEGLGPAYVAGFRRALATGADLIVQMDCDFSHDPGAVPRLVAATQTGDVAIGSRWVAGGSVVNWPLRRHALSRGGSLYARRVLDIDVRDLTGGFKCWRREVLEAIDLDLVRTSGYGFQIELTFRAVAAGFSVVEVPIRFTDRAAGTSKMSGHIAFEALRAVPSLRRSVLREAA
ncbi:Undecaprenyl-phosphate mannosyltransferase [Paraconexibacter sp. AEG42_29]|uniref:Undecaprenyl-phosphate mannosyltransferase n=1 Tax=Paraconexibacter sp. AEG42_29 TaxID=2997339 RepID=A0AAU7AS08_9ACTN